MAHPNSALSCGRGYEEASFDPLFVATHLCLWVGVCFSANRAFAFPGCATWELLAFVADAMTSKQLHSDGEHKRQCYAGYVVRRSHRHVTATRMTYVSNEEMLCWLGILSASRMLACMAGQQSRRSDLYRSMGTISKDGMALDLMRPCP